MIKTTRTNYINRIGYANHLKWHANRIKKELERAEPSNDYARGKLKGIIEGLEAAARIARNKSFHPASD